MVSIVPPSPRLPDPELAALIVANAVEYAIMTLEPDGRITSWSAGAERILGYTADEAVGQDVAILFTDADRASGAHTHELEIALQDGRVEDSRWHLRRNGSLFWANGAAMHFSRDGRPAVLKILRDETRAKLADEQRVLLLNELNHRVKNTLATVQSIAEQTLRAGDVDRQTRDTLAHRLMALSEAHDVLVKESWAGADLRTIIEQVIAPHRDADGQRFVLEGPPVRLSPEQAVSVSLVLHELTTNAIKHGALSVAQGQALITWNTAQDGEGRRFLALLWREAGGPTVCQPTKNGFGTRLIKSSFQAESGKAVLAYKPDGLQCLINMTLSSEEELPANAETNGEVPGAEMAPSSRGRPEGA